MHKGKEGEGKWREKRKGRRRWTGKREGKGPLVTRIYLSKKSELAEEIDNLVFLNTKMLADCFLTNQ